VDHRHRSGRDGGAGELAGARSGDFPKPTSGKPAERMKSALRWSVRALLLVLLALVFELYLRADFMVELSNRLWACF
jgi:hypothetical protein